MLRSFAEEVSSIIQAHADPQAFLHTIARVCLNAGCSLCFSAPSLLLFRLQLFSSCSLYFFLFFFFFFFASFSFVFQIQSRMARRAQQRREAFSQEAVVNPVRHAKRKLALNEKKRKAKKRKISILRAKRRGESLSPLASRTDRVPPPQKRRKPIVIQHSASNASAASSSFPASFSSRVSLSSQLLFPPKARVISSSLHGGGVRGRYKP